MTKSTVQTQADAAGDAIGALPASLRRASKQAAAAAHVAATAPVVEVTSDTTTPPTVELPAPAPKAKRERKASAKAKTPKAAKVAKEAKKPHQPSTIASTEANPAKSIVPVKFKKAYAANNDTCGRPMNMVLKDYTTGKNADGRDCLDLEKLAEVAKANGIDDKAYSHLNNGQKRMNVGNKLAGLLKQGKKVIIGKRTFANAEKALAAPQAQAKAEAEAAAAA